MNLAISNIGWTNEEEPDIAATLNRIGISFVEIAPTKLWEDPSDATDSEIKKYIKFWTDNNIEVVAFQSMLFNHPEFKLFADEAQTEKVFKYLKEYIVLARKFGAKKMIFGSPKNRQKGGLTKEQALEIAIPFFQKLGDFAAENNTMICIEPNAEQYACDFVTNAQEGIDIVNQINSKGIGLHLDVACMALAGDDVTESIINAGKMIEHFHISSPMLEKVEDRDDVPHLAVAKALMNINYEKYVSIEMKPGPSGTNKDNIVDAINFVKKTYSLS